MNPMARLSAWLRCLLPLLWMLTGVAWAQFQEQGALVTQSQGAVRQGSAALVPFVRLAPGVRLQLADAARVQLLYLDGGRQETWTGPAELQVGAQQSQASGAPAQVRQLPPAVAQALARSHEVIGNPQSRQGMIRMRAVSAARVAEAQAAYQALREQLPEEDITPELFLLGQLLTLRAFDAMRDPLAQLLRRQPDHPQVQALHQELSAVAGQGSTP